MRYSVLLPLALALSASASLVLPLPASAGSQITRRQVGDCTNECSPVEDEVNACGTDLTCLCTSSVAQGLQKCAACQLESDPTSEQTLQTALDQYASGCEASGQSVGSLTLTATGAASSTSSVRSASLTSTSAITSVSTPPAFATSTSSVIASISSAAAAASSSASATPAGGLTGSGNGASSVVVQMTGTFVAAGIAAALVVL
ncbi:hypothetical protein M407DRAFT_244503 [Tulasnella calospora MUT 4182]|uniref:Extracellular membrane protein CFEM domain-containing protein n=1 Tax=Tulasnella calospora MUT 4182 TaxID=1051891 RepID=A0A0C3QEN1_9AGAM|nr:hypothetical protein M407DRAFT_244503 [Tulasnella calospora MUT 4182]